jgi:hypothetical protein
MFWENQLWLMNKGLSERNSPLVPPSLRSMSGGLNKDAG